MDDLGGRHFLITGATSGIGRATAVALAARGASLTLAGRDPAALAETVGSLRGAGGLHTLTLDLASLASVRAAAGELLATDRPLHVLINNAAVAGVCERTGDGLDRIVATNAVGPYLLTRLLLPRLLASPSPRVVNLASHAHARVRAVRWEDLRVPAASRSRSFDRYFLTKLLNIVHARELARVHGADGLVAVSVHPGGVASNVYRSMPWFVRLGARLFLRSPAVGAEAPVHWATTADVENGAFYHQLRLGHLSPLALDPAFAAAWSAWVEEAVAGPVGLLGG